MVASDDCIANIGPRERRRRLTIGAGAVVAAVIVIACLIGFDVPRFWRIVVFMPWWVAALCFLEARARTCVMLAARGARNLDDGDEPIANHRELQRVAAQARAVHVQAALLAAVLTGAVVAFAP